MIGSSLRRIAWLGPLKATELADPARIQGRTNRNAGRYGLWHLDNTATYISKHGLS
jgi:hypothetical protein